MTFSDRISRAEAALGKAEVQCARDYPLASLTTFRIGGPAALAIFPRTESELIAALTVLREVDLPLATLGGGSNLLAPDKGFSGAVLCLRRMSGIEQAGEDGILRVLAGTPLSAFARYARDHHLAGAEFLYGIPGTLGGAVRMNAGAFGGEISALLRASTYIDAAEGNLPVTITGEAHAFGYRTGIYEKYPSRIILSATLALSPGDKAEIDQRMQAYAARRRESQPLEFPSAGSAFKRPTGSFAGKLIEECGLKGYRVGDAMVSPKHAGFIVNCGAATEQDVRTIMAEVRATVLRETGYLLESEIQTMEGKGL